MGNVIAYFCINIDKNATYEGQASDQSLSSSQNFSSEVSAYTRTQSTESSFFGEGSGADSPLEL
jgi:hypothetical protein